MKPTKDWLKVVTFPLMLGFFLLVLPIGIVVWFVSLGRWTYLLRLAHRVNDWYEGMNENQ